MERYSWEKFEERLANTLKKAMQEMEEGNMQGAIYHLDMINIMRERHQRMPVLENLKKEFE